MANRALHLVHSHHRRAAEVFAGQLATSLEAQGIFENGLCRLYGGDDAGLPTGDLPTFNLEASKETSDITGAPRLTPLFSFGQMDKVELQRAWARGDHIEKNLQQLDSILKEGFKNGYKRWQYSATAHSQVAQAPCKGSY